VFLRAAPASVSLFFFSLSLSLFLSFPLLSVSDVSFLGIIFERAQLLPRSKIATTLSLVDRPSSYMTDWRDAESRRIANMRNEEDPGSSVPAFPATESSSRNESVAESRGRFFPRRSAHASL